MVQLFEPDGDTGVASNITAGNDRNLEALASRVDLVDISYTIGGGITDRNDITWASPSLSNADMPNGTYRGGVECSAIGGNSSYKVQLSRYQSGDTRDEILDTSASQNSTGPFISAPTVDPSSGATGDRIVMEILSTRTASHGNETFTFVVNDVDSLLEVPFDAPVGGFAHSHVSIIG